MATSQSFCSGALCICHIQKAPLKKTELYVEGQKSQKLYDIAQRGAEGIFPMNFCSFSSSCAVPFVSMQQREMIGLDGKIRRAEQADSAEGERLSRIGWKPA